MGRLQEDSQAVVPGDWDARCRLQPQHFLMDTVDPATRSRMMSRIRGRNTRPELAVRRYLHAVGLRFRLGGCGLPGRPDLVFPGRRAAVFVHGCFWHQHRGCRFATRPSTHADFWQRKFNVNVERDARALSSLEAMGWIPLTIWECETRSDLEMDKLAWQILGL
jgi:DNA mismatch endonuclease (patch repair protein)